MNLLVSLLVFGISAAQAHTVSLGAYKTADIYCSNPKYVFTPDEQEYIDTLTGKKGSCIDGRFSSPPCFEDFYVFSTANSGNLVSRITFAPGVSCVTTTEMTYSESKPGVLEFVLGKSTSRSENSDPNSDISCENQGQGNRLKYQYKQDGKNLLLIIPDPPPPSQTGCGNYIIITTPVPQVPQ